MDQIPCGVAIQLFQPPLPSFRWCGTVAATVMPMPKTSMHENNCLVFLQYDVRTPWQPFAMQPKPKADAMQH